MTIHELKTDPEQFEAVLSRQKTLEIRKNDRGFEVGDFIFLRKTRRTGKEMEAGSLLVYSGEVTVALITHVTTGYGLQEGYCALSFASVSPC